MNNVCTPCDGTIQSPLPKPKLSGEVNISPSNREMWEAAIFNSLARNVCRVWLNEYPVIPAGIQLGLAVMFAAPSSIKEQPDDEHRSQP